MEPFAVLQMYKWLYGQQVIVGRFVADDDSSVKDKLKWSNADHMANNNTTDQPRIINSKEGKEVKRPNHGGIPAHMPEPDFVADPNHRCKTLTNDLYTLEGQYKTDPKLDAKKKNPPKRKQKTMECNLTMSKNDVKRITKNFAFMVRSLHQVMTDKQKLKAGKCVLEHHFDNHEDWVDGVNAKNQLAMAQSSTKTKKRTLSFMQSCSQSLQDLLHWKH